MLIPIDCSLCRCITLDYNRISFVIGHSVRTDAHFITPVHDPMSLSTQRVSDITVKVHTTSKSIHKNVFIHFETVFSPYTVNPDPYHVKNEFVFSNRKVISVSKYRLFNGCCSMLQRLKWKQQFAQCVTDRSGKILWPPADRAKVMKVLLLYARRSIPTASLYIHKYQDINGNLLGE